MTLSMIELARMGRAETADAKDNLPHVKLAVFGKNRSENGCYRHNGNILRVTGIEADYDAGEVSVDEVARHLAEAGIAALVFTSASHGLPGKGHRYRIFCPFSTEKEPSERTEYVARLNGALGGILSGESFTTVQSFAHGHVEGRPTPQVRLIQGQYIDLLDYLAEGAVGKRPKAEIRERQPAVDQSDDAQAVRHARARLAAAAKRVAALEPGDNRNAGLNAAAFEMGGLVACATLSEADVVEALVEAAVACGFVGDYGNEDEAERIVKAGLLKGAEFPMPYQDPSGILDDLADDADDHEAPKGASPDQDGAVQALVSRYGAALRFDHSTGKWFEFDGNTWRHEHTGLALYLSRRECTRLAAMFPKDGAGLRPARVWEAVERAARCAREFAVTSDHWDQDPLVLGTPESVVDLRTGKMRRGRPEDRVTKRTSVDPVDLEDFDPERHCPRWLALLRFALSEDEETIRFLQQWAGMSITGITTEQKLLFVHGGGGNGKGVTINTLAWVAGDYALNVPSDTLTAKRHEGHPTELARLHGVRFAYASEVERGARWAETRVKSLTGGDPITARYMRRDFFTFTPQLTLTVIGNDRPSFTSVDDAIRRRFLLLEMDRKPTSPDPDLPEKLRLEGSGILSWMILGALDWQQNGLVVPPAVQRTTDAYMLDEDHFGRFLAECGDVCSGARVATSDLHEAYETWQFAETEAPPLSMKGLAQEMLRRGFDKVEKVTRSDGGRGAGFAGFRLRDVDG
jgi:P4 family phage/plasmid primase-like protien